MKFLLSGLLLFLPVTAAQLRDVKNVYLLPMTGGLDQHLAERLTADGVFKVVSDPKLADAVFTDSLGAGLEYRLDRLSTKDAKEPEPHGSSFSRGKGTVFLVDTKSRQVIWSTYRRSKNTSSDELNRTAKHVVKKLSLDLNPPALKQ